MMGSGGTNSTQNAMNLGCFGLAFAAGKAFQDGVQRARDLRAVDEAHVIGQRYVLAQRQRRKQAAAAQAEAAMTRLLANRARIHGN